MKLSLIITTYNWKEALDLVFKSVSQQTNLPDEVLIADDGSRPDTGEVIAKWSQRLTTPVHHIWQEDIGFRAARARNLAIAAATGEYIVFIDGDMVLHPHFIEDHRRAARHGHFIQGVRLLTGPEITKRILVDGLTRVGFFSPDIKRRRHTIRNRFLSSLVSLRTNNTQKAIKTCNQGYWREDLIEVNGFNEGMVGYSREDNELAERLFNAGVQRKNLKFGGLAIHLHHNTRKQAGPNPNDVLFQNTIDKKLKWCEPGLSQHLRNSSGK